MYEPVAYIAFAACRQLCFYRHHRRIERCEGRLQFAFGCRAFELDDRQRFELGAQTGNLSARYERFQLGEFFDQRAVAFRCLCLPFERPELTTDFAQEVLHSKKVRFGGIESTLGLFLPLAKLENARCLFDDRTPVFGTSVQHCVDLTLADDHVLLTADTGVAQQLLHVEQAAAHPIDHVLGLARAEQNA